MYPSEYGQPVVRNTNIHLPVIAGYTTGRYRTQVDISGLATTARHTRVVIVNESESPVQVQLVEVANLDFTPSGTRTALGPAQSLAPLGEVTYDVEPQQNGLEVACLSGEGKIRATLSSQIRWDVLSFSKTDSLYPAVLWSAVTPS